MARPTIQSRYSQRGGFRCAITGTVVEGSDRAPTGARIELRKMSVYQVGELRERFDLVLFMGVLYHLRHPLLALDLLHEHAVGGLMVFQSLLRGSVEAGPVSADYPFSEREIFERADFPKLFFIENSYSSDHTNWWIPNRAAAEAMLRSSGFEIVDHPEDEIFICRRRDP